MPLTCERCQFDNPELEGKRKLVTVLFSDLSGYTALTEKLNPEEVPHAHGHSHALP